MLRIGNIEFDKYPVFLAPMEDVTDPSFRFMCKKFGADMMYSEFISSDGLIRGGKKGLQKLEIFDYERPVGIQLYGHLVEPMVEAAKIAEQSNPDLIDLNFGCPVKKISNRGAGAGMMKDVPKMVEMTKKIVDAVKVPVTVKTRLGWDTESLNVEDIAERLQDVGIKAITIHGRTKTQMYKGKADWTLIGKIKNNSRIKIPVIGNGDITSAETAKEKFDKYGVDAIMIGRGSIGRPQLFKEIKHYLKQSEFIKPYSVKEKVEIAKEHLAKSIERKGEYGGVITMRRHFANYFKNIPHFRETRIRLLTAKTPDEVLQMLNEISCNFDDI